MNKSSFIHIRRRCRYLIRVDYINTTNTYINSFAKLVLLLLVLLRLQYSLFVVCCLEQLGIFIYTRYNCKRKGEIGKLAYE